MLSDFQKDALLIYTIKECEKINVKTKLFSILFCFVSYIALCQGK